MKILTFDLEDWFHILAHEETASPPQWERFESRIERNTDWILERLDASHQPATFFCLGWIAEKHPQLIKKIAGRGHEIACHSMYHQLLFQQPPADFREDLRQSVQLLEDIIGKKVVTYRAPGFSVSENSKWVFEILAEAGILNDCSIFPAARNHGGYPGFGRREPCVVSFNGISFREFPMSMAVFLGMNIPLTGGGYFRLAPYRMIYNYASSSDYVMTYFHPRDFDAAQPVIKTLPFMRRFMSYTGLKGAGIKLRRLLDDFSFVSVDEAVNKIDWKQAPVVVLK